MLLKTNLLKYRRICFLAIFLWGITNAQIYAQDTTRKLPDLNQTKIVKKINALLDSTQKKIKNDIYNKANDINDNINNRVNNTINKFTPVEEERPLPYEKLLNKKYNLGRRAYQNTVAQYNYLFYADDELNQLINKARNIYQEDYSKLLSFYDYALSDISKSSIDSIIYRCNANIVLHDLRSNWVDDSYLLLAKAYLFHKNYDTAGSILQFINYSFDEKIDGLDLPIGSNARQINGKFSIANQETNRIWENVNIRNESMVWQARNYLEANEINEGISLLQMLKGDALFPKRLYPFLNEQLAYGYYLEEAYENAATHLIEALPNAIDNNAKSRWYYLIAQMWQEAKKIPEAYTWFKKASEFSPNPIIGVYAKINMVRIDAKKSNQAWQDLANELLKLTNKEKYKPYGDIIFFEMAKLAIENKDFEIANKWLITSIKSNNSNNQQKQQSFELLGEINYRNDNFEIANIAYDSLTNILKSNPAYETIMLRKKWMHTILDQTVAYQKEDSLQHIYKMPKEYHAYQIEKYNARVLKRNESIENLFKIGPLSSKNTSSNETQSVNSFSNSGNSNGNDFYFLNTYNITQGKQQFVQKWGERPNVDMWRRKSSPNIANALAKQSVTNTLFVKTDSSMRESGAIKDTSLANLLVTPADYINSQIKWNTAALATAQTFLLKLNDFSKAKTIYQKIVERNIEPSITERALLDMASEYLHQGNLANSESIIKIVTERFPNGDYIKKKTESETKKNLVSNAQAKYQAFYFLSQIGNWNEMNIQIPGLNQLMRPTKWNTPYQFLKVKMYAQQKKDIDAIQLLDSIIMNQKSDLIQLKAKNILTELKNRKKTEDYLTSLQFSNETMNAPSLTSEAKEIVFTNDSLEKHYIAIATFNLDQTAVLKMQTAIQSLSNQDYPNLKLITTISQLQQKQNMIWIGPFDNGNQSIKYLQAVKPKLANQIVPFIPQQQYEIYIFGKSNIGLINDAKDLNLYKTFMINKIHKP